MQTTVLGVETCGSLKRWDLFLRELLFYRFYARFSQVSFFLPTLYEYDRSAPAAATDPRRRAVEERSRPLRRPRDLDSRIRGGRSMCEKLHAFAAQTCESCPDKRKYARRPERWLRNGMHTVWHRQVPY